MTRYLLLLVSLTGLLSCRTLTSIKEVAGACPVSVPKSLRSEEFVSAYQSASRQTSDSKKLGHFLKAAKLSYPSIGSSAHHRRVYNAACAEAAHFAHRIQSDGKPILASAGEQENFEVAIVDADSRNFLTQERIVPAARLKVKRLDTTVPLPDGIGGALVAYSKKDSALHRENPNVGREGRALAMTSLVSFPEEGKARIEIRDPAVERDIVLDDNEYRLAADFSTPLGYLGSKSSKGNIGLKAMVNPADNEWIRGLTHFEPFDPDQIPVVFIHGLQSSPRVWKEAYLDLVKDERIRENFQFWYYRYPTGYGIGHNAHLFRESFSECMRNNDPDGKSEALNQTVLVGHSMGGLLSSVSVRSSGSTVWNQIAETSPEELDVDEETRARLKSVAFFEPIPQVSRAVFMAAPHRGSNMASGTVGRLGTAMIHLPRNVVEAGLSLEAINGLTSLGIESFATKMTSIDFLKPNAWQLETVLTLPVGERVTMHSVIGKLRENKSLKESSDGIVPYWSSHIDGVASELIVHSSHTGVPNNSESIEELKRILYLHLKELQR